uniref:Uncharacterized protein n=1 Tax=Panagrolaimus superbus TaxID=310955 RepID=A0A914Z581_9BILA
MEGETDSDPMATVHKLLYEFEAKNLNTLKQKAEMEQEITVLRKTLSSRGEEERRKAKDLECMRETMKNLSEKNKFLAKELERKIDAEAECVAIKSAASKVQKENELISC